MTGTRTSLVSRVRRRAPRSVAALAVLAALAAGAGCITDLGTPEGFTASEGVDVTGDGAVVATVRTADRDREAAVRSTDGEWTLLGTGFPGETAWSEAAAANAGGLVVGTTGTVDPEITQIQSLAFAWDVTGGFRTLPIDIPGHPFVTATDVNDAGQVIGNARSSLGAPYAVGYIYDPDGALTILSNAGASATPLALNEDATVVGHVGSEGGSGGGWNNATVWAPPAYEPVTLPVPGELNRYSSATAIDEDGTIAGDYLDPTAVGASQSVGLVWSGGVVTAELPGLFAVEGIEDGSVVGSVTRPASEGGDPIAVVWRLGEPEPERLGTLGGASWATAIRDGRMVGTAESGDGGWLTRHAVRLAPAP